MNKCLAWILVPALFFCLEQTAQASIISVQDVLSHFNVVIFNNASTTADIEGAAIIGGNFSGATVYTNPKNISLPASFSALNVYANTSGNNINLNNAGKAYVGGNKVAKINFNGGGAYAGVPIVGMSSIKDEMTNLSLYLASLTPNSQFPATSNNEIIHLTPNAQGIAILDITAADLAKIPSFSFAAAGASSIIINVSGRSAPYSANYQGSHALDSRILWNFYEASSVDLNSLIGGTVLAPYAAVSNSNQIDGDLIANSWNGRGEVHEYAFQGNLPMATPEPSTLLLLGIGTAGIAILKRRKKHA